MLKRRFVSEMETRRRLAEERRDVIRQQCSRYQVILAIGDEKNAGNYFNNERSCCSTQSNA